MLRLGKKLLALKYGKQRWGERFDQAASKFIFVSNRTSGAGFHESSDEDHHVRVSVQLPEVESCEGSRQDNLTVFALCSEQRLKSCSSIFIGKGES